MKLTAAEDMAPNLFGSDQSFWVGVGEVPLELGVSRHLGQVGTGFWMTEEGFREKGYELTVGCEHETEKINSHSAYGLAEVSVDLATEDMEL